MVTVMIAVAAAPHPTTSSQGINICFERVDFGREPSDQLGAGYANKKDDDFIHDTLFDFVDE